MTSFDHARYHTIARPDEGVCCPYDPNGAIFWDGLYHLMYIYQDPNLQNGGHCWGHLSSPDLIHWSILPPALRPEPGDADTGTFSGNAFINKDGVPMLCWFGIDAGVCIAEAQDDELLQWKKHPHNPIIPIPKEGEPGHGVYTVWDPYLWLEGDTYYCLLGGNKLPNGKDTLYLLRSNDLIDWQPVGPFYEHPDLSWTEDDEDCSCPDFFRLGDRWALLCISHKVGARVYLGRFEDERFYPEEHVRMNWAGGMYFAPESLLDVRERRIVWAWITDPRISPSQKLTGSGTMGLPRVLSLDEKGSLRIEPVEELETLRQNPCRWDNVSLSGDVEQEIEGVSGTYLELEVEIQLQKADAVGVKVRHSPDGSEETVITYDAASGLLRLDMSRSTLRDDVTYGQPPFTAYGLSSAAENPHSYTCIEAPLTLEPGESLRLRIFLDGPVLEVFANGRQAITQQIYPQREDSVGIRFFARGGNAMVYALSLWEMGSLVTSSPD